MAINRIANTSLNEEEIDQSDQGVEANSAENSLRPTSLDEYIGQEDLKANLRLAIKAAKSRDEPLDHVLLYGPPGLGKTTMAFVIANEMGANIRVTSGPAIERAGDLASMLTNLSDGDILFIDEIHRLARQIEEVLYTAMEDFKLDIVMGKGPAARSLRLDLPRFTIIGATTKTGSLAAPLRDRFGIVERLEFYKPREIEQVVTRSAGILGNQIKPGAANILSSRARLTPRIANRLLRRARDMADVDGDGIIDEPSVNKTFDMLGIDELGLDKSDRQLLKSIIENFGGGPVGVDTLAALLAEERATIEDFIEPYLLQIGMLERTPRGRKVSPKGHTHIKDQ